MYMFDLNRRYNQHYNERYNWPIVPPIHIKHGHSSVSYQWAIYQKYDWHGCESPSGYGALISWIFFHCADENHKKNRGGGGGGWSETDCLLIAILHWRQVEER